MIGSLLALSAISCAFIVLPTTGSIAPWPLIAVLSVTPSSHRPHHHLHHRHHHRPYHQLHHPQVKVKSLTWVKCVKESIVPEVLQIVSFSENAIFVNRIKVVNMLKVLKVYKVSGMPNV